MGLGVVSSVCETLGSIPNMQNRKKESKFTDSLEKSKVRIKYNNLGPFDKFR
jgi:hypothetical protein